MTIASNVLLTAGATVASTGAVAFLAGGLSAWLRKAFKRDEEQERVRLRSEVLGSIDTAEPRVINLGPESTVRIDLNGEGHETESSGAPGNSHDAKPKGGDVAVSVHNERFGLLLVDYYAYGLTQARRSFAVSMVCSVLGGLVLISGVALAIFRADTNGEVYAGVVTSVAGVLTTSIGALFHQQANRALKHMEDQTNKLRQDMKAERDAGTALELLDKVADERLRGRLQAAMILRFSGSELPDIDASGHPVNIHAHTNGDRPSSESRTRSSDAKE